MHATILCKGDSEEDFEAERRDRERINEEKQSAALRFEAEITSLKLQLDRCRNKLVHYTTEATRLAQQLRLKNQCTLHIMLKRPGRLGMRLLYFPNNK